MLKPGVSALPTSCVSDPHPEILGSCGGFGPRQRKEAAPGFIPDSDFIFPIKARKTHPDTGTPTREPCEPVPGPGSAWAPGPASCRPACPDAGHLCPSPSGSRHRQAPALPFAGGWPASSVRGSGAARTVLCETGGASLSPSPGQPHRGASRGQRSSQQPRRGVMPTSSPHSRPALPPAASPRPPVSGSAAKRPPNFQASRPVPHTPPAFQAFMSWCSAGAQASAAFSGGMCWGGSVEGAVIGAGRAVL